VFKSVHVTQNSRGGKQTRFEDGNRVAAWTTTGKDSFEQRESLIPVVQRTR
jgi:hypothetical protein